MSFKFKRNTADTDGGHFLERNGEKVTYIEKEKLGNFLYAIQDLKEKHETEYNLHSTEPIDVGGTKIKLGEGFFEITPRLELTSRKTEKSRLNTSEMSGIIQSGIDYINQENAKLYEKERMRQIGNQI